MTDHPQHIKADTKTYAHPVAKDSISEHNFQDIANHLFLEQCKVTAKYLMNIHETRWWSDDDTDYTTTALEVPHVLQTIAYDGSHYDLIAFLFENPNVVPVTSAITPLSAYAGEPLSEDLNYYYAIHWDDDTSIPVGDPSFSDPNRSKTDPV